MSKILALVVASDVRLTNQPFDMSHGPLPFMPKRLFLRSSPPPNVHHRNPTIYSSTPHCALKSHPQPPLEPSYPFNAPITLSPTEHQQLWRSCSNGDFNNETKQ